MSPRNNVTDPTISGSIRAALDLTSVADTDWHDLTSADFIDSTTGLACAAGLKFEYLGIQSQSADLTFIKYRARVGAGDATTNEIAFGQVWIDDVGTLRDQVITIAYKKANAADSVYIIAGFSAI